MCAPTIGQAFKEIYAMEKACRTQLAIMSAGGEIIEMSDNLLAHTAMQFERDAKVTTERPSGWESMKQMLDRTNPGYDA